MYKTFKLFFLLMLTFSAFQMDAQTGGADCDCDFEIEFTCVEGDEGEIMLFLNPCFAECEGYTSDDFVDCDIDDPWGDDGVVF